MQWNREWTYLDQARKKIKIKDLSMCNGPKLSTNDIFGSKKHAEILKME